MSLTEVINNDESLFRCIQKEDYNMNYDKKKDRFSAAYFKENSSEDNAFSVDRSGEREENKSIECLIVRFRKRNPVGVIKLNCMECRGIPTHPIWKPSKNKYHSEIWDSETQRQIEIDKCRKLALIGKYLSKS